jgi:hypothetical protein
VSRLADIRHLYELLDKLEHRMGGARRLRDCDGRMGWPARGVYFFLDPSELRTDSGTGARVVRAGTHVVTKTSRATLWSRLAQHRGTSGRPGGNHRASIFRKIVGEAVAQRGGLNVRSWGHGSSAGAAAAHFGVPRESLIAKSTDQTQGSMNERSSSMQAAAGCRRARRSRRTQPALAGSPPGCRRPTPGRVALRDVAVVGGAPSRGSPLRPGLRRVSSTPARWRRHRERHRARPTRRCVVAAGRAASTGCMPGTVSCAVPGPGAERRLSLVRAANPSVGSVLTRPEHSNCTSMTSDPIDPAL